MLHNYTRSFKIEQLIKKTVSTSQQLFCVFPVGLGLDRDLA